MSATNEVELTGWMYLSFADDEGFRGGAIVEATELIGATILTHALGINPGGQVLGVPIPVGFLPDEKYRERLLTKEDVQAFWPDAKRIGDMDDVEVERERTDG